MKRLRMLPLAVLTVLAAVALAAPMIASASQWETEGALLKKDATLDLSGGLEWGIGGSELICEVSGEAVLYPGDEGQISSFNFDTCDASGAWFKGCTYDSASTSAPWSLTAGDHKILVSDAAWEWSFDCPGGSSYTLPMTGDLTLEPESKSSMAYVYLSGKVSLEFGGTTETFVSGDQELSPAGVYGFGSKHDPLAETVLCEDDDCEGGAYPRGTEIAGVAWEPSFNMAIFAMELSIECENSLMLASTNAEGSYPKLPATVSYLGFEGCETHPGGNDFPCTLTATGLPYDAAFSTADENGDGSLSLFSAQGGAPPALEMSCTLYQNQYECTFEIGEEAGGVPPGLLGANLELEGGSPAGAIADGVYFERFAEETESCPTEESEAWLQADYEVVAPDPLFVGVLD